ncbi:MAG: peptidoglycan-binding domain-containing protein, partial [Candidatus Paceibacterota bacterium]
MSKLLKSKVLFGLIAVAFVLGGVYALSADYANAQTCTVATTLRQGSTGADVICLQTKLGITADGKFGPMTAASVKAYQASNGLVADGVVGPMTRAILNASAVATPAGLPAGCTSTAGYSPITGEACSVVMTLPAGCLSTAGYSSTTGVKCDSSTSVSLPEGCLSTAGYSTVTGEKCDGSTTETSSGSLEGGAGDMTASKFTSGTETTVAEASEEKVLGVEVEADDNSDIEVTSMRVKMTPAIVGSDGSTRLTRYAEEVLIYLGNDEVGSIDAADFSRDGAVHTATISLDDAVVKAGDKERFYVAFVSKDNIDSEDLDNTIAVEVDRIRFSDATGAILTTNETTLTATVDFEDSSVSNELRLQSSSSNPSAKILQVENTRTSDE